MHPSDLCDPMCQWKQIVMNNDKWPCEYCKREIKCMQTNTFSDFDPISTFSRHLRHTHACIMNMLNLFKKFIMEAYCPKNLIQNFPLFHIFSVHCSMTAPITFHLFICGWGAIWHFGQPFTREGRERRDRESTCMTE